MKQLVRSCIDSERVYRGEGYRTVLLPDLPPKRHAWSSQNNERFWKLLLRLGQRE